MTVSGERNTRNPCDNGGQLKKRPRRRANAKPGPDPWLEGLMPETIARPDAPDKGAR